MNKNNFDFINLATQLLLNYINNDDMEEDMKKYYNENFIPEQQKEINSFLKNYKLKDEKIENDDDAIEFFKQNVDLLAYKLEAMIFENKLNIGNSGKRIKLKDVILGEVNFEDTAMAKDKEQIIELLTESKYHLIEMSQIGTFFGFDCYVYSKEGENVPHFHLVHIQEKRMVAIQILAPKYFIHDPYNDILNGKEKKQLIEFLNLKPKNSIIEEDDRTYYYLRTNYEYICYLWKQCHPEKNLNYKNVNIPNYRLL